jgi:hypothetical protein
MVNDNVAQIVISIQLEFDELDSFIKFSNTTGQIKRLFKTENI